jgi:predicted RNA-binding protein YlqC (UPF0109 family)
MKELAEYIARSLVDHPEDVLVREIRTGRGIRLELSVAKDDMGRIIGKRGKVANAIRSLLQVAAEREGLQVSLDILEP